MTVAMANTGRVVGGAVTSAKGALSSWFGGFRGKEEKGEEEGRQEEQVVEEQKESTDAKD